jgi:hypothetical protein
MSVRVVPWSKRGKSGFEIDIRITWPEGGKDRVRLKSPVTGHDASKRWGIAREREIILKGKADFSKTSEPPPNGSGNGGPSNETARAPTTTKEKTPTLAEFGPRSIARAPTCRP